MRSKIFVAAVAAALFAVPAVAHGAPPPNDNRASAQVIPSFPAQIAGTTVEATVEQLDPQISKCGGVEATVWYRIEKAPDGTIALAVKGAGLAPVLRVYQQKPSSIAELTCGSAKSGAEAAAAFQTTRGNTYLVLVGRRAGTTDAAFTLTATRFLPPANDTIGQAKRIAKLPGRVSGSTLGATSDEADPPGCHFAGGTVWYALPRTRPTASR